MCGKSRSLIGEARVRFDVMLGVCALHSDETETKPGDSGDDGFRTATDGDENQPDTQFRETNPTGSADDGLGKDRQSVGPAAGPVDLAPVTRQKAKVSPPMASVCQKMSLWVLAFTPRPGWSTHLRVAPKQPIPLRRDELQLRNEPKTVLLS